MRRMRIQRDGVYAVHAAPNATMHLIAWVHRHVPLPVFLDRYTMITQQCGIETVTGKRLPVAQRVNIYLSAPPLQSQGI